MKNTKKLAALLLTVLTMGLVLAFTTVNACAAEAPKQSETVTLEVQENDILTMEAAPAIIYSAEVRLMPMAAGAAGGAEEGAAATGAEGSYATVLNFFITWIRRIGAAMALIGGIMFGLAIKENQSDQKQAGLMTMVAGFIVVAICLAANMFDRFS